MNRIAKARCNPVAPWITAGLLAAASAAAPAASLSYAYAQVGFNDRTIGVYEASMASEHTQAAGGIGFAEMSGSVSGKYGNGAYSGAHGRTDFTVQGISADTPLTFTWYLEEMSTFTDVDASWGWSAFFGVTARYPFGGSYSLFGNQVTQGPFPPYSLGNPDSIVQCNGNTRGQSFCGQRHDTSGGLTLSVTGFASDNDTGYIEQTVGGDGWNVDFLVRARLIAVTVPSAIYFDDGSGAEALGTMLAMSASASEASELSFTASTLPAAYLQWQDGSVMAITVAGATAGAVPLPGTLALAGLALLGLVRQRRA